MTERDGDVRLRIENIYSLGWFGKKKLECQIIHLQQLRNGVWIDVPREVVSEYL